MKRKYLALMLLFMSGLLLGCSVVDVQEEKQENEPIWVIAEEISYDENETVTMRNVYHYNGDAYNYRCEHYDGTRILNYTDVIQSEDGRMRTEKTYQGEHLLSTEVYHYDIDGKELYCEIIFEDGSTKREWHWSEDGKIVEITDDDVYLWTEEYDEQGRKLRSYGEEYETVYTYGEQEKILRTAYANENRIEYVVHQYDAQGREIETCNYEVNEDRSYTETDLIAHVAFTYDADEHSYWMQSVYDDGEVQVKSSTHTIYKPLEEVLQ